MEENQVPQQRMDLSEAAKVALSQTSGGKFSTDEIRLIWAMSPPTTRPVDFERFIYTCANLELNPILNEVHIEYRSSKREGPKMAIVTHVEAYRRRGAALGVVDGTEESHGTDPDLGFWVEQRIWFKGHTRPFTGRAHYNEYAQGYTSEGGNFSPTEMWKNKMYAMTSKCAEAISWRKAGVLVGTVSEEELEGGGFGEMVNASLQAAKDQLAIAEKQPEAQPAKKTEKRSEPKATPATATPAPPAVAPTAASNPFAAAAPAPAPAPAPVATNPFAAAAAAVPAPAAPKAATAPPADQSQSEAEVLKAKINLVMTLTATERKVFNIFALGYFGAKAEDAQNKDKSQELQAFLKQQKPAAVMQATDKLQAYISDEQFAERNKLLYANHPFGVGLFLAGRGPAPTPAAPTAEVFASRFKWGPELATRAAALCKAWNMSVEDLIQYLQANGFNGSEQGDLSAFFRLALRTREAYRICEIRNALAAKNTPDANIANLLTMFEVQLAATIEQAELGALESLLARAAAMA